MLELLAFPLFLEFIQLAKDFEDFRKKWRENRPRAGQIQGSFDESRDWRSALDVKLKHARNQVDVEIKAETAS